MPEQTIRHTQGYKEVPEIAWQECVIRILNRNYLTLTEGIRSKSPGEINAHSGQKQRDYQDNTVQHDMEWQAPPSEEELTLDLINGKEQGGRVQC